MIQTYLARTAFVLLAGLPIVPLMAQQDLPRQVQMLVQKADAGPMPRVWEASREIAALDGQEDALVKAILAAGEKAGDKGRLAAARALADIAEGDVFGKEVLDLVTPVSRSQDQDARIGAISVLGNESLFNRRILPNVQSLLEENATSELVAPLVRVEACRALWRVGDEQGKHKARSTLQQFLASRDQVLRIQGALGLAADINTDPSSPAWSVLRQIQHDPTPDGRLARSIIRLDEERRQFESWMEKLRGGSGDTTVQNGDDPFAVLREIMGQVNRKHLQGHQLTDEFLLTSAAKGMMSALDKHSSYFTSEEYQKFFFDLNREYGGIGAFVNFDRDDVFSITRPIYSGPAYTSGLRSGDKILEVDGWETAGQTSDAIIARLKGKPGTPVALKFFRVGFTEPKELTIIRRQIQVPAVNHDLLPGDIGYIELITFASTAPQELTLAIKDLIRRGAKGLVLDVRNNTGGYLEIARDVVELFISGEQLVVYTAGRDVPREEYKTRNRPVAPDLPLAILINEYSASASEIVAGALQDMKRATIIGKRSFGKGSVQTLLPMRSQPGEPGPRMKLTVARYHLPSGRTPNKEFDMEGKLSNPDWGIIPDHEVDVREMDPRDAWKNSELFELLRLDIFNNYVKERIQQHRPLFLELADGDQADSSRYPDFDTFYDGLKTKLSKDDVRRWIRYAIRDQISDTRGKAYPGNRALGDFQEDGQLQEAVRRLMTTVGLNIEAVKAYQGVLKPPAERTESAESTRKRENR